MKEDKRDELEVIRRQVADFRLLIYN